MKYLKTNNSTIIPALGLGTWKSNKGEAAKAVSMALDIGYKHFDCAPIYQNEKEIGEIFHKTLQQKTIKRNELFITSKLWNNAHRPRHVRPALERTLKDLQLDYLDLFLIHWPVHFQPHIVFPKNPEEFIQPNEIALIDTWQAMEKMVKKGLCRNIGVCNFKLSRLKNIVENSSILPTVNQIECHPYLKQIDIKDYCHKNKILITAYSPLGSNDRPEKLKKNNEPSLLTDPVITNIAEENKMTPAQTLLAWSLARNNIVIPKSSNQSRLQENFASTDINLSDSDLQTISSIQTSYRYVDGHFFGGKGSPYSVSYLWDD